MKCMKFCMRVTKFMFCIEQMLSKYAQNVIFKKNYATFFMRISLVLKVEGTGL